MVTPRGYAAGRPYTVHLEGPSVDRSLRVTAGPRGRLRIEVPLGPSNPYQQYTVPGEAVGTKVYTTAVTIRPAR